MAKVSAKATRIHQKGGAPCIAAHVANNHVIALVISMTAK